MANPVKDRILAELLEIAEVLLVIVYLKTIEQRSRSPGKSSETSWTRTHGNRRFTQAARTVFRNRLTSSSR